jgi:hypothetical protein
MRAVIAADVRDFDAESGSPLHLTINGVSELEAALLEGINKWSCN